MSAELDMVLWLLGDAVFTSVLCAILFRKGRLNASEGEGESCDVCGSNCGQCGVSYRQKGDGTEVFNAAVKRVGGGS